MHSIQDDPLLPLLPPVPTQGRVENVQHNGKGETNKMKLRCVREQVSYSKPLFYNLPYSLVLPKVQ